MSFTKDVKRELAAVVPAEEHCRRAQLAGLVFGAGTVEIGSGGRFAVRASFALPSTARRLLALLYAYDVGPELRTVESAPLGRRYEIVLGGEPRGLQLLNEIGMLTDGFQLRLTVPGRVVERRCCLIAFLRGLFLGCGSISMPGTPVHAEFTVEGADLASGIVRQLARLSLDFHLATRGRNVACYTKRGETAADLLTLLGAHDARLRWEEHLVLGQVRESANRLANCDEANARRAADAGRRQVAAVRRLRVGGEWLRLPPALREAAELRLAHPHLSLGELAALAQPPLTKSALNHRLRRLLALAGQQPRRDRRAGEAAAPAVTPPR